MVGRRADSLRTTIDHLPFAIHHLLSSELRLALLNVGVQPFFRVFRLEELLLQLSLERQRILKRNLGAGLNAAFDSTDSARCFVRQSELARIVQNLLRELLAVLGLIDLIDDPKFLAAFKEIMATPKASAVA